MLRGVDEHQMKRRSFAFSLAYIKCFRTYSVYLSLRLPAQILYAGIHLPPQMEARALPRRALSRRYAPLTQGSQDSLSICLCGNTLSKCAATGGTPKHLPQRGKYFTRAKRVFHRAKGAISHGGNAAVFHCGAKRRFAPLTRAPHRFALRPRRRGGRRSSQPRD